MSKSSTLKRILNKDIKEIENQKLNELGIYIHFDEENMLKAKAMITGPKGSIYESGFLFFNIDFPTNYPYSAPDLSYVSRNKIRIHPNLYVGHHKSGFGKVCLSILGTWSGPKWTTIMDISTVLITIQSLLDNNPLHHEPGQEKENGYVNNHYNEVIRYETLNTLLIRNYIEPPAGFEIFNENMKNEISKINKESIIEELNKKIDYYNGYNSENITICIPIYRIKTNLNYKKLLLNYQSLILN